VWWRAAMLLVVALIAPARAESPPTLPFPRDYKTELVKYAVVDRSDGTSRNLYVSRDAIEALRRNPRLQEFPAGVLFALDVHSATLLRRDAKTGDPIFEKSAQGRLMPNKDERTLHLMQKIHAGSGSRNWVFGGFDTVTAAPLKLELPGDCVFCHEAALVSDMSFSLTLLKRFVASGAVQYSFCPHPGRQSCPF